MSGLAGSSYIPLQVPKGICKDRRLARVACSRAISLLFGRPTDQLDNVRFHSEVFLMNNFFLTFF